MELHGCSSGPGKELHGWASGSRADLRTWIGRLFLPAGNYVTDGVVKFYYGYLDSK